MGGITPGEIDVTCECGQQFGIPIADLESEFACPNCGEIGTLTAEQIEAVRTVVKNAEDRVRRSLAGILGTQDQSPPSKTDVEVIAGIAQRMVDVLNESLRIANDSTNIETRRSRSRVAHENLARLRKLARDYPFLKLTNLEDVQRSISEVERETEELARRR